MSFPAQFKFSPIQVHQKSAATTIQCVNTYCRLYGSIFTGLKAHNYFKYVHLGLISDIKKKSLPAIAQVVGLENGQGVHHFLTESPWQAEKLEKRRLEIILRVLQGRKIEIVIDETRCKKKRCDPAQASGARECAPIEGEKTNYVKKQYIDNLGKTENGIVSINAYGYCEGLVFPLKFKIFKPKERLKEGDKYQTKLELAAQMIQELVLMGFKIKRILVDSFYDESSSNFLSVISSLGIEYAVAISSNHGVRLLEEQRVRLNKQCDPAIQCDALGNAPKEWRIFEHTKWDGKKETRYIREIIDGKRKELQYWEITRDKENITDDNSWFVITKIPGIQDKEVGEIDQIRTWIQYGFKNTKSKLGWADFRVTNYAQIHKWWELVMSAYLMICLYNEFFNSLVASIEESYSLSES